jgi:hypothetical protein
MTDKPEKTTRRRMLKRLAGMAMATPLAAQAHPQKMASDRPLNDPPPGSVLLEDAQIRVAFDHISGALTGLTYKPTGWVIQGLPDLGCVYGVIERDKRETAGRVAAAVLERLQ